MHVGKLYWPQHLQWTSQPVIKVLSNEIFQEMRVLVRRFSLVHCVQFLLWCWDPRKPWQDTTKLINRRYYYFLWCQRFLTLSDRYFDHSSKAPSLHQIKARLMAYILNFSYPKCFKSYGQLHQGHYWAPTSEVLY